MRSASSTTTERTEGEFRGPSATIGYHRNPDATAKLFRSDWLDTGDVGYIAGGELFLTSRAKDLIKRGGHNIHPYDLEAWRKPTNRIGRHVPRCASESWHWPRSI